MLVDKKTLCALFGVSERSLTEWTKEGMPVAASGGRGKSNQYESIDVLAWYIERQINKATVEGDFEPESAMGAALMKERTRKMAADADISEITASVKRGDLLVKDRVRHEWSRLISDFRQAAMQLPLRLAPKLLNIQTQERVKELVKKETDAMLTALSREPAYGLPAKDENDEASE